MAFKPKYYSLDEMINQEKMFEQEVAFRKSCLSWETMRRQSLRAARLGEQGELKALRARRATLAREVALANKQLLKVRQAALLRLLEMEHREHQRELGLLGKAFYVERL
ncbi:uncharacterized protein C1orf189 homolog [Tachyglossus aculeatus]|uniref:uncharacterized protein C1orf189 homolog n=1 Tax=Tachyglossus aculeatus TaxID=9261 RepID=UPI0018F42652|nr:uncharacterized protein C1orf189 homolog [Tachyglossus aculeatus]